ncbi:MAG TPA: carbohydrate-binding protein [Tepidisphaeraceae bacterium]|jgi:hypothetical protein
MFQRNHLYVESLEGRQLLSAAWGAQAKLIGQDLVAQQFPQLTGAGETVAVIDSGVDYNHPALGGGWGKKVIGGWDYMGKDSNPMSDSYAHGTGVAGMIASSGYDYKGYHFQGIAPGVKLVALRQNNQSGVAAALQWVIANKSKYNIVAVNMTDYGGGGTKTTGNSIKASLATLDKMGVYVASPSGNGGTKYAAAEWSASEAIVGSVTNGGGMSGFTQRGPALDFLAPGDKITLPYYDVGSKKHIYVDSAVGTSWSSPQIAGAAAILRQINPKFTNAQITSILKSSGASVYDSATKRSYSRLNLYNAVKLALKQAGKPTPPPPQNPDPTPDPKPPYSGGVTSTPTNITGNTVLEVENFDAGNEGQAYHDTDSKNTGGNNYRAGGVDVISMKDQNSTRAVGMVKAGEWLKYTVNVTAAGSYHVEFRVAALGSGGAFHLEVDGKNVSGTLGVPDTKNWNTYASVQVKGINLTGGKHTMRLVFDKNGRSGYVGNFNLMRFARVGSTSTPQAPSSSGGSTKATPYKSVNLTQGKTATIQAEDFDNGANGVAYKDWSSNNEGKQYRTNTGVDIEKSADSGGGYNVGYMKQGEWLDYTVNVTKAGTFNFDTRVASLYANAQFHFEVDGKWVTDRINFANTGSFQKWYTIHRGGIKLSAGKHVIRLVIDSSGGHKWAGNVNWIKIG